MYYQNRINGVMCSIELNAHLRSDEVVGYFMNAASENGDEIQTFIGKSDPEMAMEVAKRKMRELLHKAELEQAAESAFEALQELPLENRKDVLCFVYGMMENRMTQGDIDRIEAKIKETRERIAERMNEIIDEAEELPELNFEIKPDCPLDCDELDDNKQCRLVECKFKDVDPGVRKKREKEFEEMLRKADELELNKKEKMICNYLGECGSMNCPHKFEHEEMKDCKPWSTCNIVGIKVICRKVKKQ